jgi:hypothetical protein
MFILLFGKLEALVVVEESWCGSTGVDNDIN